MKIFVGNLSFSATEADVRKVFEGFGNVASVKIVMEKKGIKSRGFGFVQMPDDQQAQDAISALSGKEFMGRPLNVGPARPKPEAEEDKGEEKKIRPEIKAEAQQYPREEKDHKEPWFNPVFRKKRGDSGYKQGRRSRSFMKRRVAAGINEQAMPKKESRENPMRWRKKQEQPKPWKKAEGESNPWRKSEGGFKPWSKSAAETKPWKKSAGESKPWRKSNKRPRPHQSRMQSRRKPGGYKR